MMRAKHWMGWSTAAILAASLTAAGCGDETEDDGMGGDAATGGSDTGGSDGSGGSTGGSGTGGGATGGSGGSTGGNGSGGDGLGGMGGAGALGDFTLNLTMFNPHVGDSYVIKLFDSDGDVVFEETGDSLASAAESFGESGIIDAGETYRLKFYMDLMDNDTCDEPPDDHVWEQTGNTPDAGGDLVIDFQHNTTWDDCTDL